MIRHIVLIRFMPEVTEDQIAALFAALTPIKAKVAGMGTITAGRSESPEQMERGFLHGFVVDFDDWAALHEYLVHPDHQALGGALVAHAMGGKDGILVFDLAVDPT